MYLLSELCMESLVCRASKRLQQAVPKQPRALNMSCLCASLALPLPCSTVVTLIFEVLQVVSRQARKVSCLLDKLNEVEGWMQVGASSQGCIADLFNLSAYNSTYLQHCMPLAASSGLDAGGDLLLQLLSMAAAL